jgi:hypothetical protein
MPARRVTAVAPALGLAVLALAACTTEDTPPLVFGQHQVLGVNIGTGATGTVPNLTLGFQAYDIAIVPVVDYDANGDPELLTATDAKDDGSQTEDTFSVLGQFDVQSQATDGRVGLGKFFATGFAARNLASGFAAQLGNQPVGGGTSAGPDN